MSSSRLLAGLLVALLLAGCSAGRPASSEADKPSSEATMPSPPPARPDPAPPTPPPEPPAVSVAVDDQPRVILYRRETLWAGRKEEVGRWRLRDSPDSIAFARDYSLAILYPGDIMIPGAPPALLDLKSGEVKELGVKEENPITFAGWLPDGRMLLVGRSVWIGGARGEGLKRVSELRSWAWITHLSPDGRFLMRWGPNSRGRVDLVDLVDLATGAEREVEGPFRRGAQDGGVSLAWSPDSKLVAGADHDNDATGLPLRTRIIDPFSGKQVRSIEGIIPIAWLPSGEILGWQPNPEDRPRGSLILVDPQGGQRKLLDNWASPSPDGRWLLYTDYSAKGNATYLVEVRTGERRLLPLSQAPWWTGQGDLVVVGHGVD